MIKSVSLNKCYTSFSSNAKKRANNKEVIKRISIINSLGLSTTIGALTTVVSRTYTSDWKKAGLVGLCASLLSFAIITPNLLSKNKTK